MSEGGNLNQVINHNKIFNTAANARLNEKILNLNLISIPGISTFSDPAFGGIKIKVEIIYTFIDFYTITNIHTIYKY